MEFRDVGKPLCSSEGIFDGIQLAESPSDPVADVDGDTDGCLHNVILGVYDVTVVASPVGIEVGLCNKAFDELLSNDGDNDGISHDPQKTPSGLGPLDVSLATLPR